MGTQLKLDIASPIIVPAVYQWQMQHYEVAVNVRLARRFYPTLELGYAGGRMTRDTIAYSGQGGFFRVGCDLHPLKRHPELPHALLVGIRLGTAVQQFDQNTMMPTGTDQSITCDTERKMSAAGVRADCWGEIVAGCQVEIAKVNNTAFYMGWMGRFKCLFTRTLTSKVKATIAEDMTDYNPFMPAYIPGFGKRDNIGWGVNYYLGWKF